MLSLTTVLSTIIHSWEKARVLKFPLFSSYAVIIFLMVLFEVELFLNDFCIVYQDLEGCLVQGGGWESTEVRGS